MKTYRIEPLRDNAVEQLAEKSVRLAATTNDWNKACLWASRKARDYGVEMAIFGADRCLEATFAGGDFDSWIKVKSGSGIGIQDT